MSKKTASAPRSEAKGLTLLAISILLALSLLSFQHGYPKSNWIGLIGHGLSWMLSYLFGLTAYGVIGFLGWIGCRLLACRPIEKERVIYFSLFLISIAILLNLSAELGIPIPEWLAHKVYRESSSFDLPYPHHYYRYNLGGVPLYYLYRDLSGFNLQQLLSEIGIAITFTTTAIVTFALMTNIRLFPLLKTLPQKIYWLKGWFDQENETKAPEDPQEETELVLSPPRPIYTPPPMIKERVIELKEIPFIEKKTSRSLKKPTPLEEQSTVRGDFTAYELPPLSLLNTPKKIDHPSLKKDLRRQADILEETLMSFGIEAKVGEIHCGPTITSFEVHPAVGVKVQKITALENDIALNLQARAIRIIAPIPGKAAVGVEIPSLMPQEVSFKELMTAYQNHPRKFFIPILLGKTVSGDNVMSDLAKMPHAIIAGATGSGKSVCINTIVMSILMNARPDEIKLLMIDPKKVELTSYSRLPHLIAPVITEPHGAYAALNWLVKEMQLRYDILKQLGLRNIGAFNHRSINKEFEASLSIPVPETMPAIVAIVDEFADLMMVSSSDLETPIARIAQMARAVGIHLILATQRPSREVITGLIKANFPTRIAFKVASRINSQIILDETGAESLLGNGDMLFLPPGSSHLIRAQGAFISDDEINRVMQFICNQASVNYLIPSFDTMRKEDGSDGIDDDDTNVDSLFEQAKTLVIETNTASTTFLQRKLKIGYARAASLMDELETRGIISPQEGAKPRRVLLNRPLTNGLSKLGNDEKDLFET
ncbi:MAG: DNA translocase FtsK 4TM domain-containing protein [Simkania sp.]|nr:DNA translocase FtsK 4TM domain-containing protein [Simkania sp.]